MAILMDFNGDLMGCNGIYTVYIWKWGFMVDLPTIKYSNQILRYYQLLNQLLYGYCSIYLWYL